MKIKKYKINYINFLVVMQQKISFCLWGNKGCYNWGALENALIAQKLFPGWTCRYYMEKVLYLKC